MNRRLKAKLELLRTDYSLNNGKPFEYFFCPILFTDEDTELAIGHLVNQAFPNSSRAWTVQRKDIEGFFGSYFEADFVSTQHRGGKLFADAITDKNLSRLFKPEILIKGKPVDFFIPNNKIPANFTLLEFDNDGELVELALKIPPKEVLTTSENDVEIFVSKDARLPALVSLIKSAHLTLFELLGYRYALSATGRYLGGDILGKFYLQNKTYPKKVVVRNALSFFREFEHMIRPLQLKDIEVNGTIDDKLFYVCHGSNNKLWGLIVFVRTSDDVHAVLTPTFSDDDTVVAYLNFLKNENEHLNVSWCQFNEEEKQWEIDERIIELTWPKSGILYPEK